MHVTIYCKNVYMHTIKMFSTSNYYMICVYTCTCYATCLIPITEEGQENKEGIDDQSCSQSEENFEIKAGIYVSMLSLFSINLW